MMVSVLEERIGWRISFTRFLDLVTVEFPRDRVVVFVSGMGFVEFPRGRAVAGSPRARPIVGPSKESVEGRWGSSMWPGLFCSMAGPGAMCQFWP